MKVALPSLVGHSTRGSAGKPPQQIHYNRSMTGPLVSTCQSSRTAQSGSGAVHPMVLTSRSEDGIAGYTPGKMASYTNIKNALASTIQQLTKLWTGKERSSQGGRTNVINLLSQWPGEWTVAPSSPPTANLDHLSDAAMWQGPMDLTPSIVELLRSW